MLLSATATAQQFKVMSCNIRVTAIESDKAIGHGWQQRSPLLTKIILNAKPDIVCMQEVIPESYADMSKNLKAYHAFGFAGSDMDKFSEGYHGIAKNPIFFLKSRYELVAAGTYWLSDQPLIAGSMSWETSRARNCSWVRLRDKKSGKEFRVVNVHIDHISDRARASQIDLVIDECAQYEDSFAQIMCGDFNCDYTQSPIRHILDNGWTDSYNVVHSNFGERTFHDFKGDEYSKGEGGRIDYIFERGAVTPISSTIVKDHEGELFPSDHYFVLSTFSFK